MLIEVGRSGISFLWFTKVQLSVRGIAIYNFTGADILPDIKSTFELHQKHLSKLASVTVCYDFKESVLVPSKYKHSSINEQALSLLHGDDRDTVLNNDLVTSLQVHNYYRIPKQVEALFSKQFPAANIIHSTSLQLEQMNQEHDLMYCVVFHNSVKVILYISGKPQIVQQSGYNNPADLTYFLLNICKQHNANPSELQLRLSGMIDKHSKLYNELGQYFSKIDFDTAHDTVYEQGEIKNMPAHFFSNLIAMASCVS